MKVLITSNSFDSYRAEGTRVLAARGLDIVRNRYGRVMTQRELIQELDGAAAIILSTEELNETVLASDPELKVVSRYGVGVDNIDLGYLGEHGIALERAVGCNSQAVADYTVGLMIDVCRGVSLSSSGLKHRTWTKRTGIDVCGKRVGIIGLGSIGKEVAKRLRGFGCELSAHDVRCDDAFCRALGIRAASREDICRTSDIITLHAPANRDGSPLIDARAIASLKDGAVLINTARRSLVDEASLARALRSGKVFGYGSDAPLSADDIQEELIGLDHVVITPHNAAVSREASCEMSRVSAENVVRHLFA